MTDDVLSSITENVNNSHFSISNCEFVGGRIYGNLNKIPLRIEEAIWAMIEDFLAMIKKTLNLSVKTENREK